MSRLLSVLDAIRITSMLLAAVIALGISAIFHKR